MEVICSCNRDRVNTEEVEFLNIEEGLAGEDRMTFVCPFCGEDHTSVVLASPNEYNPDRDYWSEVTYSTPADLAAA